MEQLVELFKERRGDRRQLKSRRQKAIDAQISPLGKLITTYFQHDKQTVRKIEENKALLAWEELVGPSVARVSKAERVRGSELVVRVADGLWMQQLVFLKRDLLAQYQQRFPDLRLTDIFFRRG